MIDGIRKGQAAIEYLTTYGWAIIVLIMMVSALSFFGVINPRQWAPDRCELGAEMHCVDHVFDNDGSSVTLKLILKNNLRERINIESLNCTFEGIDSPTVTYTPPVSLGSGEEQELNCSTSDTSIINMNGKIRSSFIIHYIKKDGLFYHDVQGAAFSQVNKP